MEAERQEGETHLSLALAAAGEGTFDWNVAEDRTVFSPRGWRFSASAQVILRRMRPCLERIHPEDREWVAQRFEDCLRMHRDYEAGVSAQASTGRNDGCWRRARASGSSGRVTRAIGVLLDITERKEWKMRSVVARNAFAPPIGMRRSGCRSRMSPGGYGRSIKPLCTILGYSEEELLTRTYQSPTHPG